MNEYLSQTDLGRIYGVSSHQIGKWLTGLGLRESGQPTKDAFNGKLVRQCTSRQPGTFFYVWNTERITDILDKMGYERAVLDHEQ